MQIHVVLETRRDQSFSEVSYAEQSGALWCSDIVLRQTQEKIIREYRTLEMYFAHMSTAMMLTGVGAGEWQWPERGSSSLF